MKTSTTTTTTMTPGAAPAQARRRREKLRKGPGRLTRTTRREWRLMLFAAAVTNAKDGLLRAKYDDAHMRAQHLQDARYWGAEARKHYADALGKGRRAA